MNRTQKDFAKSVPFIVSMNPDNSHWTPKRQRADSLLEEARIAQDSGDWLGAEEKLRAALVVDPENGKVNGVLGHPMYEQGRFEEAQVHWELAVKVNRVA
ncbi:MAG: hypothetical protein GY930_15685 [bacterium]|nr:hypothetical protein [bacterium]